MIDSTYVVDKVPLAYQALLAEDVLAVEQGGAPVVVVADGTGAAGTGGLQLLGTRRSAETLKWEKISRIEKSFHKIENIRGHNVVKKLNAIFPTHPALHELLAGHLEGPAPGDERLALEHHVDGHQDDPHHLPGDAVVTVEQVNQPKLNGYELPVQLATPLQK